MAFAEKLIAVRRANNLTQEQLAAKLYVTRQAVSRWERGEVTPGIDMMKLNCRRDRRATVPPARNARALLRELRHAAHAR